MPEGRMRRWLREAFRMLGAALRTWIRALGRGFRWLLGVLDRAADITLFTALKWGAGLAIAALILGVSGTYLITRLPSRHIPQPEPVDEIIYLHDQGWGPGRESPLRQFYYYTPQGASLRGMRYRWFVNLELPDGRRLADPDHLRNWGFLVDSAPTAANPDQLPVGFARRFDPHLGEELLDLTCALCHSGQINVTRNGRRYGIRIDGGPGMHAVTEMAYGHFTPVLVASMASTYLNPFTFNRFANKVLGEDHSERGRSALSRQFRQVLWNLVQQGISDNFRHLYPVEEGFGRTDAVGRIANRVFGDLLDTANYRVADAPVSYPAVWDIWKFDWVQYSAEVRHPMARNLGESLGTGADFMLRDPYGGPLPAGERFRTSSMVGNLQRIEDTLKQLKPPRWPEDLLGPIDCNEAKWGRELFEKKFHCIGCHGPRPADERLKQLYAPLKKPNDPLWIMTVLSIYEIGTDPTAALNFVNHRVDLTKTGLSEQEVRNLLEPLLKEDLARTKKYREWLRSDVARLQATKPLSDAEQADLQQKKHTLQQLEKDNDASIARQLDQIDLRSVSPGAGLNYFGLLMRRQYYKDQGYPPELQACLEGLGDPSYAARHEECRANFGQLDLPQGIAGYKARPLAGVWATAPYLHNGSVPNLYEMLLPADQRSKKFFVGRREFDPVRVGLSTEPLSKGGFWLDTRQKGNANTGHEFRAGYVPWQPGAPPQYGVIGPEMSHDERMAIIEYLKIHQDDPQAAPDRLPKPCGVL